MDTILREIRNKRERRYSSTAPDPRRNKTRQPRKTTTSLACKTHPTPGLGNFIIGIILQAGLHVYLCIGKEYHCSVYDPTLSAEAPSNFHFLQAFYSQNHLTILVIFLGKTFTTLTHGQNTHGHYRPVVTCSLSLFRRVIRPFWQTNDIRTCHWYVSAK